MHEDVEVLEHAHRLVVFEVMGVGDGQEAGCDGSACTVVKAGDVPASCTKLLRKDADVLHTPGMK